MSDQQRGSAPSASNAYRYENCPGSHSVAERYGTDEDDKYSLKGDRVHGWLAAQFSPAAQPELTDDDERTAQECLNILMTVQRELSTDPWQTVLVEKRLWYDEDGPDAFSGQEDLLRRSGKKLLLVDFKTGYNAVAAANCNSQIKWLVALVYANLLMRHDDELYGLIVQPHGFPKSTLVRYSKDDAASAFKDAMQTMRAVGTPRFVAGDWCKYCPVLATCSVAMWRAQELDLDIARVQSTNERTVGFLRWSEDAEVVIKTVSDHAKTRLIAGEEIPGLSLKPGSTRSTLDKPLVLMSRTLELGVKPEQYMAIAEPSKKDLTTLVKSVSKLKGTTLDDTVEGLYAGITTKKTTSPSLVVE